jgi:hypothetical protein
MRHHLIFAAALASLVASGANAQAMPRLPGGIGGLPNISGMGLPNVAGVLGYCAKNQLFSGSGVGSLVNGLAGKPGVKSSPDYTSGLAGTIKPAAGRRFR